MDLGRPVARHTIRRAHEEIDLERRTVGPEPTADPEARPTADGTAPDARPRVGDSAAGDAERSER